MSEERIEFACEDCGETMSYPVSDIGTVQQCPHCGEYVDVPEERDQSAYEGLSEDERARMYDEQALECGRQQEVTRRQLDVGAALQEETRRQLEDDRRYIASRDEQFQKITQFLGRCEALADRFERVLERWEAMDR